MLVKNIGNRLGLTDVFPVSRCRSRSVLTSLLPISVPCRNNYWRSRTPALNGTAPPGNGEKFEPRRIPFLADIRAVSRSVKLRVITWHGSTDGMNSITDVEDKE